MNFHGLSCSIQLYRDRTVKSASSFALDQKQCRPPFTRSERIHVIAAANRHASQSDPRRSADMGPPGRRSGAAKLKSPRCQCPMCDPRSLDGLHKLSSKSRLRIPTHRGRKHIGSHTSFCQAELRRIGKVLVELSAALPHNLTRLVPARRPARRRYPLRLWPYSYVSEQEGAVISAISGAAL
jgi:hypothetical protein